MPIHTFLRRVKTEQEEEGGVFDPEQIEVMATAFEKLIADLNLKDRDDPIVTMVAKLVIELVRNGERDPEQIARRFWTRIAQRKPLRGGLAHGRSASPFPLTCRCADRIAATRTPAERTSID